MNKNTESKMQEEPNGVVIPQNVIEDSNANKRKGKKTLAQLPVYRATANLKFVIVSMMQASPKKLLKFFDQMLVTVSEAKKAIGMADIARSQQDRAWYLDCARVLVQDLSDDFTTLRKLPAPIIGRDLDNKAKALVKSVIAQLVAWRDYTRNEGADQMG